MSGLASSALAFAPVFVVQFGDRCMNNNRRRKRRQHDNENWHVCDSLWLMPSALSSAFSFLLIFLLILCSIGDDAGVKASEIPATSFSTAAITNNYNANGVPSFDVNDLKNLIEIFPEFREYVLKVLSSHVEKQQRQTNAFIAATATTTPKALPFVSPTSGYLSVKDYTSPNSRKDFYSAYQQNGQNPPAEKTNDPTSKLSYGWGYDDHYHKPHGYDQYGYPSSNYGYGYGPSITTTSHHYGWSPEPSHHHHHHEIKDPKYHYQVGYQLGKDVSCVLSLLGFKSIKDFSLHSIFSFLKKLKYVALIGLAFKLGIILSPLALPTLLPFILLAVIVKILPLLVIICLLFTLLKTQLKLGIGKRTGEIGDGGITGVSSMLAGTPLSRLWESIEDVTQSVVDSESCVEKMICKMTQQSFEGGSSNSTIVGSDDDIFESQRGFGSVFLGSGGIVPRLLQTVADWIFPKRKWKLVTKDNDAKMVWECDKIRC